MHGDLNIFIASQHFHLALRLCIVNIESESPRFTLIGTVLPQIIQYVAFSLLNKCKCHILITLQLENEKNFRHIFRNYILYRFRLDEVFKFIGKSLNKFILQTHHLSLIDIRENTIRNGNISTWIRLYIHKKEKFTHWLISAEPKLSKLETLNLEFGFQLWCMEPSRKLFHNSSEGIYW